MRTYLATALVLAMVPAVIHSGLDQDRGSAGPAPAAGICQSTTSGGHHPYFEQLVARGDCWKANALRTQALIDAVSHKGPNTWVTYDAATDAARAVIPAFIPVGLPRIATVGHDRLTFSSALSGRQKNLFIGRRGIKVDDEILTVIRPARFGDQFADNDTSVLVNRGQFGTAQPAHPPDATVQISQNNLLNQLRVPLGTADGNTYLITWDARYDSSYLGNDLNADAVGHKEFQLSAGRNGIWLETRVRADGTDGTGKTVLDRTKYVALIDGRYYADKSATFSGMTKVGTIQPQAARFFVRANVWTRFWWLIDQRADDFDRATLWVADETTAPVKVFDGLMVNAREDPSGVRTIAFWWAELNTSYDLYRGAERDLVSWVRNFAALRNPGDVTPLLVRPTKS
jgi:hypothetical protein